MTRDSKAHAKGPAHSAALWVAAGLIGAPLPAWAQFISGGGGGTVQVPNEWLIALASFAALIVFVIGFAGYVLFRFLRRSSSGDGQGAVEQANAGFTYFPVPEPHKAAFADAMQGFTEYAKLKGYSVSLAINSTMPGKVGIKFEISDSGVTVSTAKAKSDLHEYVEKVLESDDLEDMPIVTNPTEHRILVSALQIRISHLKRQAELYKSLFDDLPKTIMITHGPPTQNFTFQMNQGERNALGNNYSVDRSPGSAIGEGNTAHIEESSIVIGSSNKVRTDQGVAVDRVIELVRASQLGAGDKADAVRYLQNIKEEVKSPAPDKGQIAKYLARFKSIFTLAVAGAEVYDKADKLLAILHHAAK